MLNDKPTKSGIIIEDIKPEDWMLGASGLGEELVPDGDWSMYLPSFEKQRKGFETMCCTNFSSTTCIETIFTYLIRNNKLRTEDINWLRDKGYFDGDNLINFSDRYDAIGSGTDSDKGNSLKAPADWKHKHGLIPETMLPWVETIDQYFDKRAITPELLALGEEFIKRFPINYEFAYEKNVPAALKKTPLAGACFAWNGVKNGVYVKVPNNFNHAIARIKSPKNQKIADSYDPYVKTLADDYLFLQYSVVYLVTYKKKDENENLSTNENTMQETLEICRRKGTPDYLIKGKGSGVWHRIADETTYKALLGNFPAIVNEVDLPNGAIGQPLYLSGSMLNLIVKVITNFFFNLKGKK